jgi:hypothetical protein
MPPALAKESYYGKSNWTTTGKKWIQCPRPASKAKARGRHCHQGKGNRQRSQLTITHADAAGIDVGSQVHYVAVPEGRADARQAKHVPGRKSDVRDCQWLQQLHTYG